METCPGEANDVLVGVRSPPLQGASQGERAFLGEAENHGEDGFLKEAHSVRPHGNVDASPEITPRPTPAEGCHLRVPIAGPQECREIS